MKTKRLKMHHKIFIGLFLGVILGYILNFSVAKRMLLL